MTVTIKEMKSQDDPEIVVAEAGNDAGAPASERSSRRFPDPFYDPTTFALMKDPVVDVNGDSHEKSTLPAASLNTTEYYPNRALSDIIHEEKALKSKSWQGSVRRFERAMSSRWGRLVEQSAFGSEEYRPLPDSFYCPILCELMTDPVITKEGITYEREAIEHWIEHNGKSPMTGKF